MSKIRRDDEGELAISFHITRDKKALIMDFNKSITWLGLAKHDLVKMANMFLESAKQMADEEPHGN